LVHSDDFEMLLPEIDCLILCVPLNAETHGMINQRTLGLLKPGAVVVNVARGPVIVENDLIAMLQNGHLSGAGLDVVETEPLPPTSPLWNMDNVIITPHVGAQSENRLPDTIEFVCDNLRRYLANEDILNVVDKKVGFPLRTASD
jgi:phosphoglycerate dehydrogenase-like enzyme